MRITRQNSEDALPTYDSFLKQRLIQQVGRSARLRLLNELKRTQGLCVSDLAERLGMSYMGVKGICLDLHKRGLLDTWRQPQKLGRPLLLYRLTQRAHDLFPTASNEMTILVLEVAQKLYGAAAAEKLLLVVFQKRTEQYAARLKGDTPAERAKWLARLRDHDGCMSEFEHDEATPMPVESTVRRLLPMDPVCVKISRFCTVKSILSKYFEISFTRPGSPTTIMVSAIFSGRRCRW